MARGLRFGERFPKHEPASIARVRNQSRAQNYICSLVRPHDRGGLMLKIMLYALTLVTGLRSSTVYTYMVPDSATTSADSLEHRCALL